MQQCDILLVDQKLVDYWLCMLHIVCDDCFQMINKIHRNVSCSVWLQPWSVKKEIWVKESHR